MLSAYLDESGIHDQAEICLICGYFGGENHWKKFGREWKAILDAYSVPEFHSKEFWGRAKGKRVGVYEGWNDDRANRFLSQLVRLVTGSAVYPISGGILVPDFFKFSDNERRFLTGAGYLNDKFISSGAPGKPYFVPFQHCIFNSAKYCKPGIRMNFYFDFNKEFKGYALDLYKTFQIVTAAKGDPISRVLGAIDFPHGIDKPGLQAADMLAYQSYQYRKSVLLLGSHTRFPSVLASLLTRRRDPKDYIFYDRNTIALSMEECPPAIRETF